MNKEYSIYGASGHAKVIIEIIEGASGFINELYDDDPSKKLLLKYKVNHDRNIFHLSNVYWIIAIGNNLIRKNIAEKNLLHYGVAVDIRANISKTVEIGKGTVIMPGVSINCCSKIGLHSIINTNASIDHDCFIENFVHISPNATLCGGVTVGEGSQVGAAAVIIPGVHIGKWATIGAGSVIIKHIPDNATVVGNPGRIVKYTDKR